MSARSSSSEARPGTSKEPPVMLTRTTEGFVLRLHGHDDIPICKVDISRSKILQNTFDDSDVGDLVPLGIDQLMLMDWHVFASKQDANEDGNTPYDVPKLLRTLKVCYTVFGSGKAFTMPFDLTSHGRSAMHEFSHVVQ